MGTVIDIKTKMKLETGQGSQTERFDGCRNCIYKKELIKLLGFLADTVMHTTDKLPAA